MKNHEERREEQARVREAALAEEYLRVSNAVAYNPLTGDLVWKVAPQGGKGVEGESACYLFDYKEAYPYYKLTVCGVAYTAHRLAYFLTLRSHPETDLVHLNGNTLDNRWENLSICYPWDRKPETLPDWLRSSFSYSPLTGEFRRLRPISGKAPINTSPVVTYANSKTLIACGGSTRLAAAKVAYFLVTNDTRVLFTNSSSSKETYIDGDARNLKWENLKIPKCWLG